MNTVTNKTKLETRSATRKHIFNIIFQFEFHNIDIKQILDQYYETIEQEEILELAQDENFLVYKINTKVIERQVFDLIYSLEKIDQIITENSIGWKLSRLDKVDLAILRLAIFEILFDKEVPNKVAINEAIEIAKEYSSPKSYKFINGILASIEKDFNYE